MAQRAPAHSRPLTSAGEWEPCYPALVPATAATNPVTEGTDRSAGREAIEYERCSSARIAIANLSASIDRLELRRAGGANVDDLLALSTCLGMRGDLLGRITDAERAEVIATEALASSPDAANTLYARARVAGHFHRFDEAAGLLDLAQAAGYPGRAVEAQRAALLQATGEYAEALAIRSRQAKEDPGLHTLGALASVLADMEDWTSAEAAYAAALDADTGVSPIPCGQLLFEWGVSAMRRCELERADALFEALAAVLPEHVPGRGHRAEVALARGEVDVALALITPLLDASDDPGYRARYAEILAARGERHSAASQAERATAAYERLLARHREAYLDQAAAFFLGIGNRPRRAVELAMDNLRLHDTPRARRLMARARRAVTAAEGGAPAVSPVGVPRREALEQSA